MRKCSVEPESSASKLKRSISNTVERKPAESIDLHQACKDDMIEVVQVLVSDGSCNLNALDSLGNSPLHYAAKHDHGEIAKLLLDFGAHPNLNNTCTRTLTPLQLACWFDSSETAHILIGNGADVSTGARYGQLAIHCAAARSRPGILEELLVKGKANPNYKDNSGFTALHIAANTGRLEIVQVLLRHGADVTLRDNDGNTPAHIAAREGHVTTLTTLLQSANSSRVSMRYILDSTGSGSCLQLAVRRSHVEAANVCLQYGASTFGNAHDTSPPLHTACIHGNIELVKLLVSSGASVHAEDIESMTPILRASLSGHVDVVNYLIDQGASLETGLTESNPLMCAVKRGHGDVIRLLLTRGSSIAVRDSSRRTCLHVAVYSDNEETLDILLQHSGKVLVNSRDESDSTPLHFSAINRNRKMILKLLRVGADTNMCDEDEKLPLHHAAEGGDLGCVKALVAVNHDSIHATDYRRRTPLYYAALENRTAVIKFLIESGARVNTRDDDRLTPLLAMAPGGCPTAITMLLDHDAKIDDLSKNRSSALNVAACYGNVAAVKLLLDRGARVDTDSSFGLGCLGAAISFGKGEACMEIIKHKRWKESLKVKGSEGFTCMKGLIEKFPDVAKVVLDKCIVSSNHVATDENFSLTYNFEFLFVHPDDWTNGDGYAYFGPQSMKQSGRKELLFHPLTKELLRLKWNSIARYQAMFSLFMYIIFVINFTLFMLCFGNLDLNTGKKLIDDEYTFCQPSTMELQSLMVSVFSGTWILVHLYRIFREKWNYFDRYTMVEVVTLGSCMMASYAGGILGNLSVQYSWGIFSLLLSYLALLFYLQTIFNSGIYVTMLFGVLKSLLKHPFQDIGLSSIKVIAMMIGELEYTRFLVEQQNMIPQLSTAVFLCFCIFLPIVLMNLLIGLAVGDIDTVQKNAELKLLAIKIDAIYALEQQLPAFILRYFYKPFIVVYPNKRPKGMFRTLQVVGSRLAGNSNDYEDILEDQERDDMETMEGVMNKICNRMNQQDNRYF
ncbi:hypothetical protein QZH41_017479, partial [Actinostola sp. cb2023]